MKLSRSPKFHLPTTGVRMLPFCFASTQFLFCWYGDKDNFDDATVVNAPASQTVDINFVLNGPGPC